MKNRKTIYFLESSILLLLLIAATSLPLAAQTITTFDPPGATNTFPTAINLSATVAGDFIDSTGFHGFLRASSGTITTFNPPADSTSSGTTIVYGINNSGAVVGTYTNGLNQVGFIRDSLGNFSDIVPTGSILTTANSINNLGQVAGSWVDSSLPAKTHGFVWDSSSNTYTSFDIAGSTGINVASINNNGQVAGSYFDTSFKAHGFFLNAKGGITTFDAPVTDTYIQVNSMNDSEEITGFYSTDNNFTYHGFLRSEKGAKEVSFDADPTAVWTLPQGVNTNGTIVGYWYPSGFGSASGFVRTPPAHGPITGTGTFTSFTVPGASYTQPDSVNDNGAIAGIYITVSGTTYTRHGFIRQ